MNKVELEVSYDGRVSAFDGINEECIWYVPQGTDITTYTNQTWWVETWEIKPSAIDVVSAADATISYRNGQLAVQAAADGEIRIYNVSGALVQNIKAKGGEQYQIDLPSGMYVINNKKFVVR